MKATFDIDEAVLRAIWRKAALETRSVSEVAEEALRALVENLPPVEPPPLPRAHAESELPADTAVEATPGAPAAVPESLAWLGAESPSPAP